MNDMPVAQTSKIEKHPEYISLAHELMDVDEKKRSLADVWRKYSHKPNDFSEQALGRFYNKKWPRFKAELRLTATMTELQEFREMSRQAWRETLVTLALFRVDLDKGGKPELVKMHVEMRELMTSVGVALGVVKKDDDATDAEEQRQRGVLGEGKQINQIIVMPQPAADAPVPIMNRPPKNITAETQMLRITKPVDQD